MVAAHESSRDTACAMALTVREVDTKCRLAGTRHKLPHQLPRVCHIVTVCHKESGQSEITIAFLTVDFRPTLIWVMLQKCILEATVTSE